MSSAIPRVDRTDLRRHLERLLKVSSASPTILSVYVNVGTGFDETRSIHPRLHGLLAQPREVAAKPGLSHVQSQSLKRAIETAQSLETDIVSEAGRGVALFESEMMDEHTRLSLSGTVWDFGATGPRPFLRPLVASLESLRNVATVLVDSRTIGVGLDVMSTAPEQFVIRGRYGRKSNRGGWYALEERRTRQKAEDRRLKLYRKAAEHLARSDRIDTIDAVYVLGQAKGTRQFVDQLGADLRDRSFEIVADTHTATDATILSAIREAESQVTTSISEELWAKVCREDVPQRTGVAGIRATANAVNRGAVDQLMIAGTGSVAGWECPSCWASFVDTGRCTLCHHALVPTWDILDSMVHGVLDSGGNVVQLRSEADGETRCLATLRF